MFTLKNKRGISVELMEYGAVIRSLTVPDRGGVFEDIVLGFDSEEGYVSDGSCIGATIGRYANRIANASFTLNGRTCNLPKNEGENCLHSGFGFHKKRWSGAYTQSGVELTLISPDGDQGFPGNMTVRLHVSLDDSDRLILDYTAVSDKDTVVNLTNHSYFNLAGRGTVLDTELFIAADAYLPVGAGLLPTGEQAPVAGTDYDFRTRRPIKNWFYDNCYILRGGDGVKAEAYDPVSGRGMRMYTDMPAVQLYCSAWLGEAEGKGGRRFGKNSGFCLETQYFPDSPNHPEFPSTLLKAGEVFKSRTVFEFYTD